MIMSMSMRISTLLLCAAVLSLMTLFTMAYDVDASTTTTTTTTRIRTATSAAADRLRDLQEQEQEEQQVEREVSCPYEMIDPGNTKCFVPSQDGKVCGYEHVWVGCGTNENPLECKPSLTCTCNLFYDEYWACAADGMMSSTSSSSSCPDNNGVDGVGDRVVAVVAGSEEFVRGNFCTPEGSIEIINNNGSVSVSDSSGGVAVEDNTSFMTDGGDGGAAATEQPSRSNGGGGLVAIAIATTSDSNSDSSAATATATGATTERPVVVTTTNDSTTDSATETPVTETPVDVVTTTDLTTTVTTTTTTTTTADSDSDSDSSGAAAGTDTDTTTDSSTILDSSSSSAAAGDAIVQPIEFYGINYNTRKGPDWAADLERCKTRQEIVQDLMQLSKVTSKIRLLSLEDCNQGLLVWSILNNELELSNLQHMWLGLWVDNDPNNFIKELNALELILQDSTTDFSHLLGISVGSEAIYRKDVTINEAITNLESTKSLLSEYNINVPTTIVEIAPIYSNSQQLRLAVDTIMTNTFPFWEAIPIDNAVDNLDENLSWLLSLPESQGKEFVLGEHGWPSNGYIDGVGVASGDNQQQYMADSYCYLKSNGYPYYIFTGIDNDWRQEQDPNNTIEGNWGFLEADLTLKSNFVDFTFDCGDGIIHSFGAVDWSVPELAAVEIDTENASCGLWLGCEALSGNCCPTPNGDYLGCCRTENFIGTTADGSSGDDDTTTTPIVDVPDDVDVSTTTTTASPSSASASVVVGDAPTDAPTIKDTTMTKATATTATTVTVTEKETGVVDTLTPTIFVKTTNNPTESPVTTITDAPITAAISKDTPVGGGDGETTTEETTNGSSSGGSNPWNENEINGSSSVSSSPTEAAALLSWSIALVVIIVVAML